MLMLKTDWTQIVDMQHSVCLPRSTNFVCSGAIFPTVTCATKLTGE